MNISPFLIFGKLCRNNRAEKNGLAQLAVRVLSMHKVSGLIPELSNE